MIRLLRAGFLSAALATGSAAAASPTFWVHEWPNTDFDTTSIESWTEIMSGGPPKDVV